MKHRKSWQEKLNDDKDLPKVVKINGKMSKRWGTGTCAIPSPKGSRCNYEKGSKR